VAGHPAAARAFAEARSALAVFMPNFVLLETFGLVFAEANAVARPSSPTTAAPRAEVLHPRNPVCRLNGGQRRFERFTAPLDGAPSFAGWSGTASFDLRRLRGNAARLAMAVPRPLVMRPAFRISRVAQDWQELFA